MKSGLDALSAPHSKGLPRSAKQRLVIGWLAILIVIILIFWLSGGLPPTSWRLLGSLLMRWGTLQPALGGGIFLPFIILLLQSLLLVVAWVMVGLAIKHEISVIYTLKAQERVMRLQAIQTLQAKQDANEAASATKNQGLQVLPEETDEKQEPAKSTGVQIVAPDKEDDPFDVDMAVFELFLDPEETEDEKQVNTAKAEEKDAVFVYGNPFEGELPEVFDYDMDLKREVQDLKASMAAKHATTGNLDTVDATTTHIDDEKTDAAIYDIQTDATHVDDNDNDDQAGATQLDDDATTTIHIDDVETDADTREGK